MTGSFQYHYLKDDEPLRVPQSVPHSAQIFHQVHQKYSPDLPAWHIVATCRHGRKVTPPPLPGCVVPYASMKVSAKVDVKPLPVGLLELEVLWGRGVAWKITPPPVLLIQRLVAPDP